MNYISRQVIQEAREKHTDMIKKMSKAMLGICFFFVIIITPEFIFLKKILGTVYMPVMLILGIVQILLVFLTPYIVGFFAFRKTEGGLNSIRLNRFAKKYKKLFFLKSTEIASDRYLSYLCSVIPAEKNKFNRFSLLCSKMYAHIARLEVENAYQTLQELERTFDPKVHYQLDFVYAKLSYAMQFCSYDEFKRLCDDNPALYKDSLRKYESILGYASLNVHDLRQTGRYMEAIDQLDSFLDFMKLDLDPANVLEPKKLNNKIYTYAHLLLDKAAMYFAAGDRDKCLDYVNESDKYTQMITCELPPLFLKDHKDIMMMLYPREEKQSQPLD